MRHRNVNITFAAIAISLALLSHFTSISWWFFGVATVVWTSIVVVGSAWIGSNYHIKTHCSNPSETERKVALTFDDGPTEFTPEILALLEKFDAKAAFFCIGKNVDARPEILSEAHKKGHIIANHSYLHGKDFDWKNTAAVTSELEQTNRSIERAIGRRARFFRPPYGVTNPSIARAVNRLRLEVIGWNVRSMDGISKNEDAIYNRIVRQLKPGAIILMHDTSQISVNVLERLLLTLRDKKIKIVRVDELLMLDAYEED